MPDVENRKVKDMKGFIKFNRRYFQMPISDTSKLMFALMISRDEWCEKQREKGKEMLMQYTIAELMKIMNHSNKTIISSIKELERLNYIYINKEPGKPNTYEITTNGYKASLMNGGIL